MLTGINHITISVNDLDESFSFYSSVIGMEPRVKWETGAYLSMSDLWFCLSVGQTKPSNDYSHIAFNISETDFSKYSLRLLDMGIKTWKENISEGQSLYILDPNGHKLEIHSGNLQTRLNALKETPYKGLVWFDP